MAEIQHPPIYFDTSAPESVQVDFAAHAYEILVLYGQEFGEQIGDCYVTYPVSERADFLTEDGEDVAMRIMQAPTIAEYQQDSLAYPSSGDYHVMLLQYGNMRQSAGEHEEDIYDWQDYIAIITKIDDELEVDVVDMRTGTPLDETDIFTARYLLNMMQSELRASSFEDVPFRSPYALTASPITEQIYDPGEGEAYTYVDFQTLGDDDTYTPN